jgi:tetratricopeptide (TPR) repeat protein
MNMKKSKQDIEPNDFTLVTIESRKLAIEFKHGCIDYTHLFVAIFNVNCKAHAFCENFDNVKWTAWLQQYYPATGNETMEDSLPLTVRAEHVIHHAYAILHANGDKHINSVHLLLALMCINCEITEAINRHGIIFEDIAEQYYHKPIKKLIPSIHVFRKKPYSKWEKFFITDRSRKKKIVDVYNRAYDLFLYRLNDDCISICEVGLSLEPGNNDFKLFQLDCYVRKLDFQSSSVLATELIKDLPANKHLKIILAYSYNALERYNEAAQVLDEILSGDPEDDFVLNYKGLNLYLQGKFTEAIPFFEKAIAIDPTFAAPWDNLGFVQYKLGRINEALELIDKSLELDKGNSYAYKNKGIIFLEQNKKEEALKNFQMSLRYGYTEKYGNEVLELMKKASGE